MRQGWEIAANYNVTTLFMADALHGLSLGDTYKQSVLYLVSLMLGACMIAPTIIEDSMIVALDRTLLRST